MVTTLPSAGRACSRAPRLKPLAVTTKARTARLPEVPTIAESGWPDYLAPRHGTALRRAGRAPRPDIAAKLREATVAATKIRYRQAHAWMYEGAES